MCVFSSDILRCYIYNLIYILLLLLLSIDFNNNVIYRLPCMLCNKYYHCEYSITHAHTHTHTHTHTHIHTHTYLYIYICARTLQHGIFDSFTTPIERTLSHTHTHTQTVHTPHTTHTPHTAHTAQYRIKVDYVIVISKHTHTHDVIAD